MAKSGPVHPFHMSIGAVFLSFLVALGITAVSYAVGTLWIVHNLERRYLEDRTIVPELRGRDTPNAPVSAQLNEESVWAAMLNRLREDGNIATMSDEQVKQLVATLAHGARPEPVDSLSPLSLAVTIAQISGNTRDTETPPPGKRLQYEPIMALLMAGVPGQLQAIEDCVGSLRQGAAAKTSVGANERCNGARSSPLARLWSGVRMQGLNWTPRREIAKAAFELTGAWSDPPTQQMTKDVRRNAFFLTEALLQRSDTATAVKHARIYFNIFVGPIQFALYFFFVFLLVLLVVRAGTRYDLEGIWRGKIRREIVRERKEEDPELLATKLRNLAKASHRTFFEQSLQTVAHELEAIRDQARNLTDRNDPALIHARISNTANQLAEAAIAHMCTLFANLTDNSRWLIRWLARSLPALGFLHTVLGIAFALVKADLLVRANSPAARATAMLEVSSVLGVAFTTTFLALFAGLIAGLIIDWEFSREDLFLDDYENVLTVNINPMYFAPERQKEEPHVA